MRRITRGSGGTGERRESDRGASLSILHRKYLQIGIVVVSALMMLALVGVLAGCGGDASETARPATLLTGAGAANTVTVNGDATVTSPPDEAVIVLTVENDGATAPAAMDATSTQSNQLLAKLKNVGIEDAAIQTSSVTLYPVRTYDPTTGKETLTGYRAQNSVKVTLKDAPTVAKVLAAGVETGVTQVSGPDWRLREDSQAVNDALKQAVAHARVKADTLAAAAGASIGEVISISEGSVQVPVPIYNLRAGAATDSGKVSEPSVSSGTLDVTATVTITYSLKR
jgi:uncharacterized protein YggE